MAFRARPLSPKIRGHTSNAVLSIQEIGATVAALASTQQAIDELVQEQQT